MHPRGVGAPSHRGERSSEALARPLRGDYGRKRKRSLPYRGTITRVFSKNARVLFADGATRDVKHACLLRVSGDYVPDQSTADGALCS